MDEIMTSSRQINLGWCEDPDAINKEGRRSVCLALLLDDEISTTIAFEEPNEDNVIVPVFRKYDEKFNFQGKVAQFDKDDTEGFVKNCMEYSKLYDVERFIRYIFQTESPSLVNKLVRDILKTNSSWKFHNTKFVYDMLFSLHSQRKIEDFTWREYEDENKKKNHALWQKMQNQLKEKRKKKRRKPFTK